MSRDWDIVGRDMGRPAALPVDGQTAIDMMAMAAVEANKSIEMLEWKLETTERELVYCRYRLAGMMEALRWSQEAWRRTEGWWHEVLVDALVAWAEAIKGRDPA